MTELIIYGRRLLPEEAQQVVDYLQHKYFADTGSAPLLEPSPEMKKAKFRTHQLQTHDFMCLLSNDATYIKISDLEIYHPGNEVTVYSSALTPPIREIYDSLNVDEVRIANLLQIASNTCNVVYFCFISLVHFFFVMSVLSTRSPCACLIPPFLVRV